MTKAEHTLRHLRRALCRPLPGLAAQLTMAAQPRPLFPEAGQQPRRAAVLLLLYPVQDLLYLVFTLRAANLEHHPGQASFPGGGWEEGDCSFQDTALREAAEELGIATERLTVLGPLTPLYVPPSNNLVHPFVAYTPSRPDFHPDPREVAGLLEVPLQHFRDPQVRREETRLREGVAVRVPYFAVGEHKIWGATAMILAELLALLDSSRPKRPRQKPLGP